MTKCGDYMRLHGVMQEIAEVIGVNAALLLVGQLPRCYPPSTKTGRGATERVILYVPERLRPDHRLVEILGWKDAQRLVDAFGGEILQPGNCADVYRQWRDESIGRLFAQGVDTRTLAEWFGLSERHVKNLAREKPQEEKRAHANDNAAIETRKTA